MNALVQIGLTNALVACGLAILAAIAGKVFRRPALTHALWLLVLLKLVTPPLVLVPIGSPEPNAEPTFALLADDPIPFDICEPLLPPVEPNPDPEPPTVVPPVNPVEPPPAAKSDPYFVPEPVPQPTPVVPVQPPAEEPQELVPFLPFPAEPAEPENAPAWHLPDWPWLTIFGGIWFGGSIVWFMLALGRMSRFHRVLRLGRPASESLQLEANELAGRMGLSDCPVVWLVPGTVSPLLWAIVGYPKLLIPAALLSRLNDVQRQALLVHELAHYRRRDHWVRCLEFVALGLYWWMPVVWWARRELREAEEECCDGWVLWTLPRAAKPYADALVETLDFLSGTRPALPPVASGLGQLDLLRRRLTMIMSGKTRKNLGGLGFLAVLGLGVLLLPTLPSWAQQATSADPDQGGGKGAIAQKSKDLDKTRAELERAIAELEALRAQLRQMQTEVEKKSAKIQQFKTELKKAEQLDVLKRKEVAKELQPPAKKKDQKEMALFGGQMNRDQVKKLLESLDGKSRDDQIKILMKQFEKSAGKGGMAVQPLPGGVIAKKSEAPMVPPIPYPPTTATKTTPPAKGTIGTVVAKGGPGGGDMEKRLANLEWKVDQILREILDMRKGGAKGPAGKGGKGGGGVDPFNEFKGDLRPIPGVADLPPIIKGVGGAKSSGGRGSSNGGGVDPLDLMPPADPVIQSDRKKLPR